MTSIKTPVNPYPPELLKWTSILEIVHYQFYGYQDINLVRTEPGYAAWMCAGWPGFILVAKCNNF